ncbi:GatB/YqeY domain-containing protein [Mesorhizobium sp. SP-1A]|uniref:GatB/YqeY domain-containing protein n=1 Tax=Mesorhizobium sp. SP-1A TaxID=3077840 RepID=UPI0028F6F8F7|nr:GatB/YqeY domain-containing protein [Mesorhizobium sp. SP-1A]
MSLLEKIRSDLVEARKARTDNAKIMLLNTLVGEAARVGKDAGNRETTDAETMAVVKKFVKNAEQTLVDLTKYGRDTGSIQNEIAILATYLPAAVPVGEVEKAVEEIVAGLDDPKAKSAIGMVNKALKERFGDAFDGSTMVPIAKRILETK